MRRWLGALFTCLALTLIAAADGRGNFVIETFPPGAQIFDYGAKYLGRSGEPISLTPGNHTLTLRLENHEDKSFTLGGLDIGKGRYPESGSLALRPLTFRQSIENALRYRWQLILPGILMLALAVALAVRYSRRLKRHESLLESLVDHGQIESSSMIAHLIGSYRVLSHLGKGGMADVYLGVPKDSLDTKAAVAIKVINRDLRDQSEFVDRFQREIVVSQGLAHSGIVEVIEWGWHGDRLYLVMELVEGRQLREVLPELTDDLIRATDLLSQLMQAVEYAHQRGVAHRDLKPENVMVTPGGRIKVMDFGLARAVDSRTLTQVGSTLGTPKYMAPEMISASSGDDRADQYSLGVMAYEILAGRLPFDSDELLFLLYCHANQEPPVPSSVRPSLNEAVDEVLMRMLRKGPRERYRDVEEARMALLKALQTVC